MANTAAEAYRRSFSFAIAVATDGLHIAAGLLRLMQGTVSRNCPDAICTVTACRSASLTRAMPKSRSFGYRSREDSSMRMFAGSRSRWTILL